MLRKKIHQIQLQIEDERCRVQQTDTRLEEIVSTTSYFLDRSQEYFGNFKWKNGLGRNQ